MKSIDCLRRGSPAAAVAKDTSVWGGDAISRKKSDGGRNSAQFAVAQSLALNLDARNEYCPWERGGVGSGTGGGVLEGQGR